MSSLDGKVCTRVWLNYNCSSPLEFKADQIILSLMQLRCLFLRDGDALQPELVQPDVPESLKDSHALFVCMFEANAVFYPEKYDEAPMAPMIYSEKFVRRRQIHMLQHPNVQYFLVNEEFMADPRRFRQVLESYHAQY